MTEISINNLQKYFHNKPILNIPIFHANQGEIISIIGSNGAGKSTFIKLLAGILLQDKGNINIYGTSNASKKIHLLVKFVPESGQGLYSYLTAMENLQYFLGLNGISLIHVREGLEELFDYFSFTPYKDTLVSELSQGNRQKLSLILSLVQKPKVLCLDEPTNGLDILTKKKLIVLLKNYASLQKTIIFITSHDTSFIEQVSTRVILIEEGHIIQDSTFQEIFRNIKEREVYKLLLSKDDKLLLESLFPSLDYNMQEEGLWVETKDQEIYRILFERTKVIQFFREPVSLEDLLYEVLR